jgi:hypothetical protein
MEQSEKYPIKQVDFLTAGQIFFILITLNYLTKCQ